MRIIPEEREMMVQRRSKCPGRDGTQLTRGKFALDSSGLEVRLCVYR